MWWGADKRRTFLIERGVEISAVPIREGTPWGLLLFGFGPAILIIAFYLWFWRRMSQGGAGLGGAIGLGRSKARRYDQDADARVTFDDVAGIDEADTPRVTCARGSSACWAAVPPRRSSTARRPPVPRTTSSRRPRSRATGSRAGA